MHFRQLGCSHHEVDTARRERMAFDGPAAGRVLAKLQRIAPDAEAVLLSTCNRVELYLAAVGPDDFPETAAFIDVLADSRGLSTNEITPFLVERSGEEVVRHLLAVAAGMESMLIGESHIAGQVKEAYERAVEYGSAGPQMHQLFSAARRAARRVAAETRLGIGRASLPSLAIGQFARQAVGGFDGKRVLVVGGGKMAEESLKCLADAGAKRTTVLNRSRARAEALAARWTARPADWDALTDELIAADVVVCATGASTPIVTRDVYETRIAPARDGRPLVALDLAVPRDIESSIADAPNVNLIAIDDLKATCERNLAARRSELPAARAIVDEEANRFHAAARHRLAAATIHRLHDRWSAVKDAELKRLLHKLPDLDDSSREEVAKAFNRLLGKLLHPALAALREKSANGSPDALLDALRRLFDLNN